MGDSVEQTVLSGPEAESSMHPEGIEAFISCLAKIAPNPDQDIKAGSHLIDDLDFGAMAFSRLGVLVYERYGIGGVCAASLRSENLTVEGFFEHCVLQTLGIDPEDR
jgi:hypothetical protein